MDRIEKFLNKITLKEKVVIKETIILIFDGSFDSLDLKKITGLDGGYRVRKGKFRIIFWMNKGNIQILDVVQRDDNTYK